MATRSESTAPDTARPYFSSSSLTLWPPAGAAPAASTWSRPPRKISWSPQGGILPWGKQTMFMAAQGSPPMA